MPFPPTRALPRRTLLRSLPAALLPAAGRAADGDRGFAATDGVRLHARVRGNGRAIMFVPGWAMPGWIFAEQLDHLAPRWRTVAFDPRSQGSSQVAASGHEPTQRGRDIASALDALGIGRAVLVGWSLGVLDVLSWLAAEGDRRCAGLVLIDNSVGEGPPPRPRPPTFVPALRRNREAAVRSFVAGMYRSPQKPAYLDAVSDAALRTPLPAMVDLLSYPRPREFWRAAVYGTRRPVLYAVTPRFSTQAELLAANHPNAQTEIFHGAGHALFVDEAARFNALLDGFLPRAAWA